jgi:uncharacterized protein (DUF924 family)
MRTIAEMKRDSKNYEEMRDGNGELYAYDYDNYINDVFDGTEAIYTHDTDAKRLAEELIDNGTDWNEARKFFYVENNNSFLTEEGEDELMKLEDEVDLRGFEDEEIVDDKKTDMRDRDITIAEVTTEFLKDKRESVFVDETTGEEPEIVKDTGEYDFCDYTDFISVTNKIRTNNNYIIKKEWDKVFTEVADMLLKETESCKYFEVLEQNSEPENYIEEPRILINNRDFLPRACC